VTPYDAPVGTVWEWKFRGSTDIMMLLDETIFLSQMNHMTGDLEPKPFRRYLSLLKGRITSFSKDSVANAWLLE